MRHGARAGAADVEVLGQLILFLPVLIISVTAHEYAHARVALWQGDRTAAELGRVTLNPLPHIDPFGTILLPALLWVLPGGFIFGWAKPVPIDPSQFRDFRRGDMLVSVAGVAANFALAAALLAVVIVLGHAAAWLPGEALASIETVMRIARLGIFFNLLLAVFNLIPVPPLDGSHLVYHLLPPAAGARYRELGRYSVLLLVAVLFFPGLLAALLYPVELLMRGADAVIGALA